ncbi:hypothetical protein OH768_17955 [Streptomyces sp. NBC_01622]|uniref:hypothetical protein n=1 Tax=Streptomyces sp. NBC_01622 TaxID=2975903 RepID=UPI00386F8BB3|nr:hypothetical protein OH768_17955 [Streptomyces sp. NBC_01622]
MGKTAVLVRLTELLARQNAVPVPVRLRDADDGADLNFERMAKQRFVEESPMGILARSKTERVWQQLLADDKPVVIADGLEEALLNENLQQNRENIIRRAIERAHEEKLPLVIASRPHSPLESTLAAIVELDPLSEEEALYFVEARVPDTDERRVDWIVETAEVTESPIYLQIAREPHRHGALERDGARGDAQRLDTRSWDRSSAATPSKWSPPWPASGCSRTNWRWASRMAHPLRPAQSRGGQAAARGQSGPVSRRAGALRGVREQARAGGGFREAGPFPAQHLPGLLRLPRTDRPRGAGGRGAGRAGTAAARPQP